MKTFKHAKNPRFIVVHSDKEGFNKYVGQKFEVIEVEHCTHIDEEADDHLCIDRNGYHCPGRMKLDRFPFDVLGCWSWIIGGWIFERID